MALEKCYIWLAWKLPRRLVYWCVVRAAAHATTGSWSHVETPAVTVVECLERWRDVRNGGTECAPLTPLV